MTFEYIKSASFRAVRADGAIGGLTPQGFIHAALYSERLAIPQKMVHKITPDGQLGEPVREKTVTRGSIIREMEIDLFLTAEAAESLGNWLIAQAEQARQRAKKARGD